MDPVTIGILGGLGLFAGIGFIYEWMGETNWTSWF